MGMMSGKMMIVLGVIVGVLLLLIGRLGGGHPNVSLAGDFVFAVSLIWGGIASDDNIAMRAVLVAVGGLFVIAAFAGPAINLASLLRGG